MNETLFQIQIKNPPPYTQRKMALQVHDRLARFLLFPRRAAPGARTASGSLTLEAALVLPLFLFGMYLLILPMRIMDTSRAIQQICEEVCMDAAQGYYLKELASGVFGGMGTDASAAEGTETHGAESGGSAIPGYGPVQPAEAGLEQEDRSEAKKRAESIRPYLTGNLLGNAAAQIIRAKIDDAFVENIISWRSSCMADGEMITLTLDYTCRLPFSVFGLGSLPMSVTASRRAWIGDEPVAAEEGEKTQEETEEIVYVGKNSTRYHSTLSCHYLCNDMQTVPFSSIASERNVQGKKYYPCQRCARAVRSGNVYIMPSGTSYHADPDCSAIRSFARAVPKSEVEHLGPCSYCCK